MRCHVVLNLITGQPIYVFLTVRIGLLDGDQAVVSVEVSSSRSSLVALLGTKGGVGTCGGASIGINGGASSSISEGTSGAIGATSTSTNSGTVSIVGDSTREDASGVPSFNPIHEFFQRLRKNYQEMKTEKLSSLQEFERKTGESLREAYTRMRRLIYVIHDVTEAHAVQYWYRILDTELRRRVRDATLMNDVTPKLAHVFALSEKIELNMMEERVMTSTFVRDTTTTSRRGRGSDAPRGRGGRGGRGTDVIERTAANATSTIENAMTARIEQLEQRLADMAGLGASTSTSYEGEDFFYLASVAQVEASVAVIIGGVCTSESRGATVELDPQRDEGGRYSKLPQSFLLSEVGRSSSMRPAPSSDTAVRT
ncbi:hypothetical protein AXG93_2278s1450 [Marchantia polymorpha subsp. ruderalis]|uniref:Retrotransposon gag domain-containing protein n=1 Tax=Marchantia polymorpha subsp. ruderalis TaxID=1480154 RepID=A0A176WID6_MARPO|nr:hypothetical protein AXG93_2278s1450 [Marchantia polymorpha subsp. ruderalis]